MAGQKEYEVELQFTAGLLSSPDRTRTQEENIDGEKAIFGSKSDIQSQQNMSRSSFRSNSMMGSSLMKIDETNSEASTSKDVNNPNILVVDSPTESLEGGGSSTSMRKVICMKYFIFDKLAIKIKSL